MAYDAYNGLLLWENKNPGALRTGVFNNYEPGNMVVSRDRLFVVIDNTCQQFDAATGELQHTYVAPTSDGSQNSQWGYIGLVDGRLYGTSRR